MSITIIPSIEEIRAISEERNKKDIKGYMDQIRTAIVNGIQQDAHNGHDRHVHTWTDTGKTNLTTRASKNFQAALEQLQQEFEAEGYRFCIGYEGTYEGQKCISHVVILW